MPVIVIHDAIHNLITFEETEHDTLLLELINTKEFQRLRRIKQLGLSHLVFPGAHHTRFEHSIGAMHMARKFLERMERVGKHVPEQQEITALAAALLHDIGHGPFSHAFEKITGQSHERRTQEILLDDRTGVHQVLSRFNQDLPSVIADFFEQEIDDEAPAAVPPYLGQIVSSQLDADRFDYLLRDSHATGTEYGNFDMPWLLTHLSLDKKDRFCLEHKALAAAEAYIFARYHMYRVVYFHKTTRAAEVMLKLLFRRYKQLLQDAGSQGAKEEIAPNAPRAMIPAFSETMDLLEYLSLDDHTITEFLKACERSADALLKQLAGGVLNRRLYKGTDVTSVPRDQLVRFSNRARALLDHRGYDLDYAFEDDSPADIPYLPYDPDSEKPATQIYISALQGGLRDIIDISEPLATMRKEYKLFRYYYPPEMKKEIAGIAQEEFGR